MKPKPNTDELTPISRGDMIGQSSEIENVRQQIERISQFTGAPVLITGETGAGKEVVAELLHASSSRADKPLIRVNCSAISESLFESELFGHRKGAFTGAHSDHKGFVEAAHDGSLFLDEISSLKLELQPKLLRFLENGSYLPVGEATERHSNAWIMAASNENLEDLIAQKRFRPDLYYRLKVNEIKLPPLRERSHDILLFAEYFLAHFAQKFGMSPKSLSAEAREALLKYPWPGNVRELKNAIQRAVIHGQEHVIRPEHLALETVDASVGQMSNTASKTL